ncbi:NAD(P)/FAD-dependent oxidoreductase [Actinomycetospora sp. CA-101289]|uniref:NAD(P)/FAD-dependent oxidoreductase n=1 Tax=Actinomycetospora sp. CA-101289 TaxID=3239893 RepID=UPI003D9991C3
MTDDATMVVVGAGLAGAKAVETLRAEGFSGRVVLVGAEDERPYERPPLSKEYLQGRATRESVFVHPPDWYADHGVELRTGVAVTGLDRDAHEVVLADGDRIGYRSMLLATGSSPRLLSVPGADLEGVHHLRTLADSDGIAAAIRGSAPTVVIGGGWIGLEVTAAARLADVPVTVIESAPLPLLRVLGPEMAQVFAELHREHGVDLRCGVELVEVLGRDGHVTGVRLAEGAVIDADTVLVGIGITPNTGLAEAAGLEVDDGIVVDQHHRTSDPAVHAAGDVAKLYHPAYDWHLRVEHWANALNGGPSAARAMLGHGTDPRPPAVLLHRPVRPRHGVHRVRRAGRVRRGRRPRRHRDPGVRGLLARGRSGAGRHERQRLGRHRRHQPPRPRGHTRRPRPARRPRGPAGGGTDGGRTLTQGRSS